MNEKPSRLGRGLAALIGDMATDRGAARRRKPAAPAAAGRLHHRQPRQSAPRLRLRPARRTDRLRSAKRASCSRCWCGRTRSPNVFEIIAGERRWRAAQRAGLNEVPVIVREVDDNEALELAIIENVQRVDLNPLEEAQGYDQLIEQFDYTQNDLAQVIGKSRARMSPTRLRLLKLPEDVRDMLARGELTAGHARTLITAEQSIGPGPADRRRGTVGAPGGTADAGARRASRRAAPAVVPRRTPTPSTSKSAWRCPRARRVNVSHGDRGGTLEIRYQTLEQLDDLCRRLGVSG